MKVVTHKEQQEIWDKEHKAPQVLLQMDSTDASSGIIKFLEWLKGKNMNIKNLKGVEICCGKGRNVIWLAAQGAGVTGIDFSPNAIKEAERRARKAGVSNSARFLVGDVTQPFPIKPNSLDFACDCFGSTDIESPKGRRAALKNMIQVLKPGGYLMVYLLSTDDGFHKEMIAKSPGLDSGSFIHPSTGKYEKAFTEGEVRKSYKDLGLVSFERVPKKTTFFGKEYDCNHIWAVFRKP